MLFFFKSFLIILTVCIHFQLILKKIAFQALIFGIFAMLHMVILYSITCYFHRCFFPLLTLCASYIHQPFWMTQRYRCVSVMCTGDFTLHPIGCMDVSTEVCLKVKKSVSSVLEILQQILEVLFIHSTKLFCNSLFYFNVF